MATGDSVSEAPMAGNPKANENIRLGDGGALGGAVLADDKGAKSFDAVANATSDFAAGKQCEWLACSLISMS